MKVILALLCALSLLPAYITATDKQTDGARLDLSEIVPNWEHVLDGAAVCAPVATSRTSGESLLQRVILPPEANKAGNFTVCTSGGYVILFEKSWRVRAWRVSYPLLSGEEHTTTDGVAVLTDGGTIVLLNETGQIKWKCNARKLKSRAKQNGLSAMASLSAGLIAISSGDMLTMINTDGNIVWTAQLPRVIHSITALGNGTLVCTLSSGGNTPSRAHASKGSKYTVQSTKHTDGTPPLLVGFRGSILTAPIVDNSPDTSHYQSAISYFNTYVDGLGTVSWSQKGRDPYHADPIGTAAMFASAAAAEDTTVSLLLARAIAQERNSILLTALLHAAAVQSFDEDGSLLDSMRQALRRIDTTEDASLIAMCDAVSSICRFMGGEDRRAAGVAILNTLSAERYSLNVRDAARKSIAGL